MGQPGELDEQFAFLTNQAEDVGPGFNILGIEGEALHIADGTRTTACFRGKFAQAPPPLFQEVVKIIAKGRLDTSWHPASVSGSITIANPRLVFQYFETP